MSTNELEVFNPLRAEITEFVAPVKSIRVLDFQSSNDALEVAKRIRALQNQVDDKRKEMVGPLNARVKQINDYCKQISQPLSEASSHVQTQLNAFAAEQERKRYEEQRRLDEERRRAEEELRKKQTEEMAVAVSNDVASDGAEEMFGGEDAPGAIEEKHQLEAAALRSDFDQQKWDADQQRIKGTRRNYEVEVVDLDQIPKEFLIRTPNNPAIIAAHKAGVAIPGVKIVEKFRVTIGRNSYVPKKALE